MRGLILTLLIASPAAASAQTVEVATQPVTVEQLYRPSSTRDPLVPSTVFGDEKGPGKHARQGDVSLSSFSVSALSLSGIMEDSRGKQALLTDPGTGIVYILRAGRIFDHKKKMVPGVTGVIRGKQVILMTEDKRLVPLNLREKDQ